ncbi:MAG: phage terminase small subunit P27 family, partial [Gemmatimonadales bacterium]|nr:phage terminase small subunit P27 family [Gemmatimonadales bacterium]
SLFRARTIETQEAPVDEHRTVSDSGGRHRGSTDPGAPTNSGVVVRPGPPPTPTALRVLRGNPGRRPLNQREPKPTATRPTCPAGLDKEAKAEWHRVVPELHRLGLLTKVDRAALVTYVQQWARQQRAEADIAKYGEVITQVVDGVVRREENPSVRIADRAGQRIRMWCAEFGLTPSARSRMQLPGEMAPDAFDAEYGS